MAHSVEAEEEGVMRASTVANQVNCPLLLDSITSNTSADVVKMKKDRGNAVFAAVTPASLACDGNAYWRENWNEAASFLTSPPLRKGVSNSLIEATATFLRNKELWVLKTSPRFLWESMELESE